VEEGAAHVGRLVLGDGLLSCWYCPSLEEVLPSVEKCCRCCCPSAEGAAECCPSAVQAWRKVLPMRGEAVQQLEVLSRCAQFQLLSIWCCPAGLSFAFIYIYIYIFFLILLFLTSFTRCPTCPINLQFHQNIFIFLSITCKNTRTPKLTKSIRT